MYATQRLAEPVQMVEVIEFRRMPSSALEDTKALTMSMMKRLIVDFKRRYKRNLVINQLLRKGMLFKDLIIAPTALAVELSNNGRLILDSYLVNPILVAI
jgi:hypothetical protein